MCKRRGRRKRDSKEVLDTRLASMDAAEQKPTVAESDVVDTSDTETGACTGVDGLGYSQSNSGIATPGGCPHVSFVADKEVVREHAQ